MTGHVVPGRDPNTPKPVKLYLIYCRNCYALYSTDKLPALYKENGEPWDKKVDYNSTLSYQAFEPCPVCGYKKNNWDEEIYLWQYNLIRWWRERRSKAWTDGQRT